MRPTIGKRGEAEPVEIGERRDGPALESLADERGDAEPEDADGEARRHLVGEEDEHQRGEDERQRRGREPAGGEAEEVRAGERGDGEGGRSAGRHHALDAEIEHAGALGDHLAHGGEEHRRRRRQHAAEDEDERGGHVAASTAGRPSRTR